MSDCIWIEFCEHLMDCEGCKHFEEDIEVDDYILEADDE